MADCADDLEDAIAKIEEWRIRLHPVSRLKRTVSVLRDVAAKGSFPESPDELFEVARAARDAREFVEISGMLPDEPVRPVARALKKAAKGDLSQKGDTPRQFQSELWVGALLSCSTDFLGVPLRDFRPEYIVRNGNLQYGIEVKRPTKAETVLDCANTGSKQLRVPIQHYHGGALVVDLTDCLESGLATTLHPGVPNLEDAQEWIGWQMRKLHRFIYNDSTKRIRSDHHHVFCVIVVARLVHWDLDDLSQMYLTRFIGCLTYPKSPKTLRGIRTAWLAELIPQGAQAAGYHDLGGHEIVFENGGN